MLPSLNKDFIIIIIIIIINALLKQIPLSAFTIKA
jgi:hypothetical protein